eukprot:CAMPEP_0118681818 /NCGR_PEP_ID=MMETSP0800-20121206/5148_1 /TAXON_ID=210618 ORGANISM="Striatella unipunctata, Strain CCMP2910" /NCGR_SAMPLE_ID=MMETSP0800 /ASSEMBLY_ACC=CAM_ASM_000638 /LENGTH=205 /DNA_ID=CAMNT_0006578153 /DNA_START=1272 /DNA_END=1889 /DNA_ORIENTATION=-
MSPRLFSLLSVLVPGFLIHSCEATELSTVEDFDLDSYFSARWYVHEQAVTPYTPSSLNFCSFADYAIRDSPTFWGHTIDNFNYAEDAEGNVQSGNDCVYQDPNELGKLTVMPCFLPRFLGGPYWVVAYDEEKGYAMVSGGQPRIPTASGCRNPTRVYNGSGLWIFTRSPTRDEDLIDEVKVIGTSLGLDTTSSVLSPVLHENCNY